MVILPVQRPAVVSGGDLPAPPKGKCRQNGNDGLYGDHVANLRAIGVTPHVTQNQAVTKTGKNRNSAIDERTTRHPGYGMSQSRRAMVECIFGWGKQHGTMRKTKHRGIARVAADFLLNLIAYNLIRIPKLLAA
jgi:Transposase DDE domain